MDLLALCMAPNALEVKEGSQEQQGSLTGCLYYVPVAKILQITPHPAKVTSIWRTSLLPRRPDSCVARAIVPPPAAGAARAASGAPALLVPFVPATPSAAVFLAAATARLPVPNYCPPPIIAPIIAPKLTACLSLAAILALPVALLQPVQAAACPLALMSLPAQLVGGQGPASAPDELPSCP